MNDDTAVLSAAPEDDGLAHELAKAAPRRWWNKGTIGLAGAVLLVGGFAGGLQAQKSWGPSQSGAGGRGGAFSGAAAGGFAGGQGRAAGGFGGNRAGAQGGAAPGGAAQGGAPAGGAPAGGGFQRGGATSASAAGPTTGTVKLVDGSTIYVQTADGNVVTVKTDGKTTVSAASKSKLSAVKAGQPVTVQGPAAADGSVTATSVTTGGK
jgi:hypothetical protein